MHSLSRPLLGPLARPASNRPPADRARPTAYRLGSDDVAGPAGGGELAREPALAQVEAALFAADEPLPLRRLAAAAGLIDNASVRRLLRKLQELYDRDGAAFQVEELAGGFQLLTPARVSSLAGPLRRTGQDVRLTGPARETLTIIAYRQPITRADVEAIRGVHCGEVLRLLMERGLVRIAGREDTLGRPVLYGTTKKFLQLFGFKSLKDLPQADQLGKPERTADPDETPGA